MPETDMVAVAVEADHYAPLLTSNTLQRQRSNQSLDIRYLQRISLAFGFFIGFIIECGALAAHVLYQKLVWTDHVPSTTDIVVFSITWATVTSLVPCIVLLFLRALLYTSASASLKCFQEVEDDDTLAPLLWHLESRFGIGSFAGVSLSAAFMDVTLGLEPHFGLTTVLLLIVTLIFVCLQGKRPESATTTVIPQGQVLGKIMDHVDPEHMDIVELKAGSLMIV